MFRDSESTAGYSWAYLRKPQTRKPLKLPAISKSLRLQPGSQFFISQ